VFVKIDAEGEEVNILRDLCRVPDCSISGIVDVHEDRLEDGKQSIERLFDENGFQYERIEHARVPVYYFSNFEDV
jgi:hypothetical protein